MRLNVVDLPILYNVAYKPPGRSRGVRQVVRGHAPFEVPEATGEEAPVAVVWTHVDSHLKYGRTEEADADRGPEVSTTRVFEGRPYTRAKRGKAPFGIDDLVLATRGDRPSRFTEYSVPTLPVLAAAYGYVASNDPARYRTEDQLFRDEAERADGRGTVRKLSDDMEAQRGPTAETWRKGLLVVDGELWSRVHKSEPYFRVCLNGQDRVEMGVTMSTDLSYNSVPFRADRHEDAVACGIDMARRTGRTFVRTRDVVLVPDPGLLTTDQAVMLATQVVAHLGQTVTNRADVEPWTPEMEASHARLLAARRDPRRDPAWAAEALEAYACFRDSITPELAADRGSYASGHVKHGAYAFRQWEDVERARRPDMQADESAFVLAF